MSITPFPRQLSHFKSRFNQKLQQMLSADELGAFILVLADNI